LNITIYIKVGGGGRTVAEVCGGKHEERRRIANFMCAEAQKIGGKPVKCRRVGRKTAGTGEQAAAAAKSAFAAIKAKRAMRISEKQRDRE